MTIKQSASMAGLVVFVILILMITGAKKKQVREQNKPITVASLVTDIPMIETNIKPSSFYRSEEVQSTLLYSEMPVEQRVSRTTNEDYTTTFYQNDRPLEGVKIISMDYETWYVNFEHGKICSYIRNIDGTSKWYIGYGYRIEKVWERAI